MTAATRFVVHGRVQGVGFRWATREQAVGLGLVGTVRNLADGSVRVEASGSNEAMAALADWLGHGPRWASVTHVEVVPIAPFERDSFDVVG